MMKKRRFSQIHADLNYNKKVHLRKSAKICVNLRFKQTHSIN